MITRTIAVLLLALTLQWTGGCKAVSKNVSKGMQRLEAMTRAPMDGDEHLVFTSFRPDGDWAGLFMLYSRNGYAWTTLNGDQPLFRDEQAGVRDADIKRGPDGTYHMVYTGGGKQEISYSTSKDLINWTPPRRLRVMAKEPGCQNAWAPELYYDDAAGEWIIHWSSTVDGKFEETLVEGDANHRIYYTTTKDFKTFADPKIFFNPGYNVIDATIVKANGRYYLYYKDERVNPWQKRLLYATSNSPRGPWEGITPTIQTQWIEGPSVLQLGKRTIVYFDLYAKGRYGAMVSDDLKSWTDKTEAMEFPPGHRHGTAFRVTAAEAEKLLALKPAATP